MEREDVSLSDRLLLTSSWDHRGGFRCLLLLLFPRVNIGTANTGEVIDCVTHPFHAA